MSSIAPTLHTPADLATFAAQIAALRSKSEAREERVKLLEEENRWLKSQLFGRSSEKTPVEDHSASQQWLFNEAEALVRAAVDAPETITIPAHDRKKRGRKPLSASLPRIEILHDLPEDQKVCPHDGSALQRIGEETSEQLDYIPAVVRVLKHIRPKYACPCCHDGVRIAPVPLSIFPKSLATPSLLAQIVTAKFVDGTPLYRQEPQFARMGITLGTCDDGRLDAAAGWQVLGAADQPVARADASRSADPLR